MRARGNVRDDDGDDREEQDGDDIRRIGDNERVMRIREKEIETERRNNAGVERRPQAEAYGDADNPGEEDEADILDADQRP